MNFTCNVVHTQISEGDIFKGGPPADAIVSKMTVHSALLITCMLHRCRLVSLGQTTIFAQGRYRFQYKHPARIGSGTVHSSHWYNYHRCGDGCKLITRFGDASF